MEMLDEFRQRFLRALLNVGKVYAGLPLLSTGDELTNEAIRQILEARDGP